MGDRNNDNYTARGAERRPSMHQSLNEEPQFNFNNEIRRQAESPQAESPNEYYAQQRQLLSRQRLALSDERNSNRYYSRQSVLSVPIENKFMKFLLAPIFIPIAIAEWPIKQFNIIREDRRINREQQRLNEEENRINQAERSLNRNEPTIRNESTIRTECGDLFSEFSKAKSIETRAQEHLASSNHDRREALATEAYVLTGGLSTHTAQERFDHYRNRTRINSNEIVPRSQGGTGRPHGVSTYVPSGLYTRADLERYIAQKNETASILQEVSERPNLVSRAQQQALAIGRTAVACIKGEPYAPITATNVEVPVIQRDTRDAELQTLIRNQR